MLSSLLILIAGITASVSATSGEKAQCPAPGPTTIQPPSKNIWDQLTKKDVEDLNAFLLDMKEYNFKFAANITSLHDNYINDVEAWMPVKADALAYLDSKGPEPERWARATIVMGNITEPYVESWLVGPLPVGPKTHVKSADKYFTRNRLPWHAKPILGLESELIQTQIKKYMPAFDDAFADLFGGSWSAGVVGFGADGGVTPFGAPSYNGSVRSTWAWLQMSAPDTAFFLYPLPFYMLYDITGQDENKWHPAEFVYDNVVYTSAEEFNTAWKAGKLQKFPMQNIKDADWALRTPQGQRRKFDDVPGPVPVQFDGPRYEVNEHEKYVDYQGWTFYLGYDWGTGLRFFDIRFKGERIIYELGAEDAIANYAGRDPASQATGYLDRYWGIGSSGVPLTKGYDCPQNAIFWNASYGYGGDYVTTPQAICIFEHDPGFPASRHTDKNSASVTKLFTLNVRWIATIGNYDYLFNYVFYPDGTIEVQVMASGYIQATYWYNQPDDEEYGTRLGPQVMGALHDHVIPFKADFDIGGTANSFQVDSIEIEEKEFPWTHGKKIRQKHIVPKTLKTEDEGRINFAPNGLEHWKIVNKDNLNKWGHPKGYRISAGMPSIHVTDPTDPKMGDNSHWSDYNINVLRYSDSERSCSGNLNQNLPVGPQVDFSTYFNGESIEQQDLVVYFNLGMHHVPRSEDLPTTMFIGARSSMMLSPFNWREGDESRDLRQSFYAVPNKDKTGWVVDDHGVRPAKTASCFPQTFEPLSLGMVDKVDKRVSVAFGQMGMGGAAGPS